MPLIAYKARRFSEASLRVITTANDVLDEYEGQGFDLTLRQLYYQFVAHDLFPDDRWWRYVESTRKWVRASRGDRGATKNADPNYKWLGDLVNEGRLAGLIDWRRIIDRTRNLSSTPFWKNPAELIDGVAGGFTIDKWKGQATRVEVWVEKDALVGVVGRACRELRAPYLSCRGYTSQSEMWNASQRIGRHLKAGQEVRLLHLGDHDPSGVDMTRDIRERLTTFIASDRARAVGAVTEADAEAAVDWTLERFTVERIALTWEQIERYAPPPNPAKITDSRAAGYIAEHGAESWELDALEPSVIAELIEDGVLAHRDRPAWEKATAEEDEHRAGLQRAADRWDDVTAYLEGDA